MTAQEIIASVPQRFDGVTLTKADFDIVVKEIERLRAEIDAHKLPHACINCAHYEGECCMNNDVAPHYIRHSYHEWLCGHFQPRSVIKDSLKTETKQESEDSWNAVAEEGVK